MKRILVAGIGNIFLGDDAFGGAVVRELAKREWPAEVRDFGIRAYDLAYAIADDYDLVILVDAAPRGAVPGTVYLIEPDVTGLPPLTGVVNGHSLNPVTVLQMVAALGGQVRRLYLVGCEPGVLECADGALGLSAPVAAAVPRAVELIEELIATEGVAYECC